MPNNTNPNHNTNTPTAASAPTSKWVVILVLAIVLLLTPSLSSERQTAIASVPAVTTNNSPCGVWDVVAGPNHTWALDSGLLDVSVISNEDVWALGGGSVVHWDGSNLTSLHAPPSQGHQLVMRKITTAADDDIWVFGHYEDGVAGVRQGSPNVPSSGDPISLHWDGTTWTQTPDLIPPKSLGYNAEGYNYIRFAPISRNDVWAFAQYGDGSMIQHWDGHHWHQVSGPINGPVGGIFLASAVSHR